MRVGFVGLGVMGRPMVARLRAAGHEVAVWARRPERFVDLKADGVDFFEQPCHLARWAEAVISIVTTSEDVEALAFGEQGLARGFAPGAVHADMSTIAPSVARGLAARYAAQGVDWLDAPVSGGGQAAQSGSLAIMVGGRSDALARMRPVFEVLGQRIVHIGEAGAGQVAKACNQMVMVAAIQACAEAMRLAAAHGVDPARLRAALLGGSAASRMLELMGGRMIARDFAAGIQARLHHKDFGLLLGEAHRLGVPLPVAATVTQQLNALMALGMGQDDSASLLRVLERAGTRFSQPEEVPSH